MAKVENASSPFFRFADEDERTRYYYEDTQEYIELRADISKKTASKLLRFAPRKEDDLDGGIRFIEAAFNVLVVGWSLTEGKPEVEDYLRLAAQPASWIDKTLSQHLRGQLSTDVEDAEGKPEE